MSVPTISFPTKNLMKSVLNFSENVHYQTCPGDLILDTLRLGEGALSDTGALIIQTGEFTGRSPKDKFIVKDEVTENTVHWNEFNIPVDEKYYQSSVSIFVIKVRCCQAKQYFQYLKQQSLRLYVIFYHPIFLLIRWDEPTQELRGIFFQGYPEKGSAYCLPVSHQLAKTDLSFV